RGDTEAVIATAKRAGVAAWIIGEVREGTRGVKFAERELGGMMPRIATVMITVLCLTPALVTAQEPQCNNIPFPGPTTACNTAVDAVRAFYPLAGMIVSGGNPVLGTARTLGGLGHV